MLTRLANSQLRKPLLPLFLAFFLKVHSAIRGTPKRELGHISQERSPTWMRSGARLSFGAGGGRDRCVCGRGGTLGGNEILAGSFLFLIVKYFTHIHRV
jgi:hypothetical protein